MRASAPSGEVRRNQNDRAEEVLNRPHDERLQMWREAAQEARAAHERGELFRLPRHRITRRLEAALVTR